MKCKEVTAKIDLGEIPTRLVPCIAFYAHIVHCTACRYYLNAAAVLKKAIVAVVKNGENHFDVGKLNQSLLNRFTKK